METTYARVPAFGRYREQGEGEEWAWMVDQLRASGASTLRVSPAWHWVTFRASRHDSRVCQIIHFPQEGLYGVSRYDSKNRACELLGEYPDAQGALRAALA